MAVQIQMRRDTYANWNTADPTLAEGEWGLETDTLKFKIGTGSAAWTSLGYSSLPSGSATLASPTFTGVPLAPTAAADTSTTQLATTEFVMTEVGDYLTTATASSTYAPLASPTFTGTVNAAALVAPLAFNAQTGTTYTFVLADAGKMVTSSNGSAQTLTVPPNSSVAFDIGTQIIVQALGAGAATLAQGSGVTIQSKDSNKAIDGQYAGVTLVKRATDTWSLIGALA
jgi:hypothetical protein